MSVLIALAGCPLLGSGPALADDPPGKEIVVFAAASLKNALEDVAATWQRETGNTARLSLAGSSRLARQIQHGAPADVFISANAVWMDVLQREKRIDPASRRDVLGNRLVLIAHGTSSQPVRLAPGVDLAGLLGSGRLAMAMVDAVPAGMYGKAALQSLGAWQGVAAKVAQTDNVRAALALVARGEAPYGIVYATDARAADDVTIAATFPASTHPPIVYPAAVVRDSQHQFAAQRFVQFLASRQASTLFTKHGFAVLVSRLRSSPPLCSDRLSERRRHKGH